jgi:WD40 repeat protein
MPANPGAQDVQLNTRIKPTPDLVRKDTPKDAALTFALKVGPMPPVTALAYSPDGKRLAVGGYRAVMLWDTTTGQPVACLTGLSGQITSLAFRPDGTQLAVAGGAASVSGEARVYDAKTFAPVGPALTGHTDVIYSIAWNAEGSRLATASHDKTARLWEWPSGKELKAFKDHSDAVTRVCFAPDGKSIYTASQDHNVRRFDTSTAQVLRTFSGHEQGVTALAVSPDGKHVVSSGPEPRLRWWNLDSGETARNSDGHSDAVNDIVFSKDGKFLASASADRTIRLWDVGGGQKRELDGAGDWLYAVALSPDGKFAAGAGADGIVRLWETANGRLRLSLISWPPSGKSPAMEWVALTPEGYYDASPAWAARLRPLLAGQTISAPRLAAFFPTLRSPESVVKSWQGAALDPAQIPAPPQTPRSDKDKSAAPKK